MAGEATRPVCVYAMAGLKRNSTKLLVVMCVGLALALYGFYIQTRSHSNPNYMPTLTVATSWLYHNFGQHIVHPSSLLNGCSDKHQFKPSVGQMFMYRLVQPVTRYSGIMNGLINLVQIVLLKVLCKSKSGADAIAGLSGLGLVVSMICLVGSFATCRLMCISCLGIHHIVIIYLAIRRRRILQTILCPTSAQNQQTSCTFGAPSNSSGKGSGSGSNPGSGSQSNLKPQQDQQHATRHTNSCVTRRNGAGGPDNHDQSRRRSNRL